SAPNISLSIFFMTFNAVSVPFQGFCAFQADCSRKDRPFIHSVQIFGGYQGKKGQQMRHSRQSGVDMGSAAAWK
ncbi:MAG: hypothetical protein ACI3X9_04800, partial [Bacteroidaceae bacterium]